MLPFAVPESQPNVAVLSASAEVDHPANAAAAHNAGDNWNNSAAIRFRMAHPLPEATKTETARLGPFIRSQPDGSQMNFVGLLRIDPGGSAEPSN